MVMKPKKSLGQNFLRDENIARKIVDVIAPDETDRILEIGPGYGVLTKYIANYVREYVGVELDRILCARLKNEYKDIGHVRIIEDDILKIDLHFIFNHEKNWKVIGNIPYHLTSEIIFKAIEHRANITSLTMMIQKEVAQRIVSSPNSKQYGILAIMSQLYSDVNIHFKVSKHVFFPKPKVDSAVVQWKFLKNPRFDLIDESQFKRLIRALFNQRRKIIKNSIKTVEPDIMLEDSISSRRPEQLSIQNLVQLSNRIAYGKKRH